MWPERDHASVVASLLSPKSLATSGQSSANASHGAAELIALLNGRWQRVPAALQKRVWAGRRGMPAVLVPCTDEA